MPGTWPAALTIVETFGALAPPACGTAVFNSHRKNLWNESIKCRYPGIYIHLHPGAILLCDVILGIISWPHWGRWGLVWKGWWHPTLCPLVLTRVSPPPHRSQHTSASDTLLSRITRSGPQDTLYIWMRQELCVCLSVRPWFLWILHPIFTILAQVIN